MFERLPPYFIALAISLTANPTSANSFTVAVTQNTTAEAPQVSAVKPQNFTQWRTALRHEAIQEGIDAKLFDQAFTGLTPDRSVIAADQNQPEFSRPVWEYLDSAVASWRVARGKSLLAEHAKTLRAIEQRYQVEPSVLVAVWGMESGFGQNIGKHNVIRSLATLAYEGRRSAFWRTQLLAALHILQEGDTNVNGMLGSWAGAMGQTQFMPGTYRQFAVDFDGDGRRDIWNSSADALASAANYLNRSDWTLGQPWGFEVKLPTAHFDYALADGHLKKTISQWQALGVQPRDKNDSYRLSQQYATLILPSGHQGPAFLLLDNFRSILKYNNSTSYALAIGLLSDALDGNYRAPAAWPKHEAMLSRTERTELQTLLNQLGFDSGKPDGIIGINTRQAVRSFQKTHNLPADGYPNATLLKKVRTAAQQRSR